jgi:hypothetical protein
MGEEPDRVAMLSDLRKLETDLKSLIAEEEEKTRRHFEKRLGALVEYVADLMAHPVLLDDYESRLTSLENLTRQTRLCRGPGDPS